MKRGILLIALLLLGTMVAPSSTANALFGMSRCEKIKQEIKKEESVQKSTLLIYSQKRHNFLKMINPMTAHGVDVIKALDPYWISTSISSKIFEINSNCFSSRKLFEIQAGMKKVMSTKFTLNDLLIGAYSTASFKPEVLRLMKLEIGNNSNFPTIY